MWKYIRRAFTATIPFPVLGKLPLNLVFVALVISLGAVREWRPVWLFGAWLELAYLWILATNERFRKAVDAEELAAEAADPQLQRQRLTEELSPAARTQMSQLDARIRSTLDAAARAGQEPYLMQSQRDGLDRLSWLYLKLLLARQMLDTEDAGATGSQLRRQIDQLTADLAEQGPESVKSSKRETLRIAQRRLELYQRRAQAMEEVKADMARIEAQVELAFENALTGTSAATSESLNLTTVMLESDLFGSSQRDVDTLDQLYGTRSDTGTAREQA